MEEIFAIVGKADVNNNINASDEKIDFGGVSEELCNQALTNKHCPRSSIQKQQGV